MEQLYINVKDVVNKKSPFLAKIPFFIRWLRKTLHEDGINECLKKCGHLHGVEFAAAVLKYFDVKVEVVFKEPLSPTGRYIFAANHPLGGMDGVALIKAVSEKFIDLRFPVNDFLLAIKNFDPIFIPINKHGSQSREALEKINKAYASRTQQILMFPAGLVSRKNVKKIMDLPWQKHFIIKAIEYQRDIIPVYIDGENSRRFYRIARWRKWLGIRFNVEMLYLPDEMFRQRGKTITIVFGKPVPHGVLKKKSAEEAADFIRGIVYHDLI